MTAWATRWETSCSARPRSGWPAACAHRTPPRGSAATSSPSCSRTSRAPARQRRSPSACAARSSLGLECPGPSATADDVLGNADLAMYAAKDAGKGRVARFEPAMRAQLVERMELGSELGVAVERNELVLEYQPLVELESGRIAGVEALIRWEHPTRGRLAPDRFIE